MAKNKYSSSLPKSEKPKSNNNPKSTSKLSIHLPWKPGLIALLVTFCCFISTVNYKFVNWDDDRNFYEHPIVQYTDADNFWKNSKAIFSTGVIGNYNPLSIWTFAVEKTVFGFDKPMYWHLNNVLLHLLCVWLVYRIALLIGIGWQGALLVALLFGIHPMRVESVAWVTERKDVLFGVFYLGAMLQYIKYKADHKSSRWIWMTLLFVLSLFSKIQAVSLPLTMLALDYYIDKKWQFSSIIPKIPFFILSLTFGIIGIITLKNFGSLATVTDTTDFNFFQRIFLGAFSFLIYLIKLIFPFRMSPLYPYPNHFPAYFYPCILMAPIVLYTLYVCYVKQYKMIFFGLVFFIVNIFFLLQILGAGQGYLADRFTYIPYLGFFLIAGYYFDKYLVSNPNNSKMLYGITGVYLTIFAFMTIKQNGVWENSATLWTHVLKYYKETTLPYGNRANYYRDNKMYDLAISDYNTTIAMKDNQPQAYNSRARLFFDLAKGRDSLLLALNDYNKAIQYDSTDGEFRVNRGATYARLGDIEKAIDDFNVGLKLKPDHQVGYLNRSIMYQNTGKIDLALKDLTKYLDLNPYNADIWYEKARALRLLNQPQEAIKAYDAAIQLESNNRGMFYYERSRTLAGLKLMNEAKKDLQQAIAYGFKGIDPSYRQSLGL